MREQTVHLTERCNLACPSCRPRGGPQPGLAALRAAVAAAARRGPARLFLEGGEPLLLRALPELVALARSLGVPEVVVATNGLLCADARRVRRLAEAGLTGARLLLPAADAEAWTRFTARPDGLRLVVQGIANLRAAGVALTLRHPVTADGGDPAAVVAFAAALGAPVPDVEIDLRPGPAPSPARLAAHLQAAAAAAAERGVRFSFRPGQSPPPGFAPPAPPAASASAGPPLTVFYTYDDGPERAAGTARLTLTGRCDQACAMCALAVDGAGPSDEALRVAVEAAAERGVARLVVTGGEPCLDPRLTDLVAHARAVGIASVELQTNAVRLAHGDRAARLAAAGLDRAFVSLHAADAAVSDALTRAPGTHARTLAGIDRLLAAGVTVDLNCVIGPTNVAGLAALVELVHARWGGHARFDRIHFHTVRGDPAEPERWRPLIAPLSAVGPALRRALARCRALGLRFTGPASAMGVPWCVLDGDPRWLGPLAGPGAPRLHREERGLFTRVAACARCGLADRCPGVRADHVAAHGDEGVRAL
jgi:molybdenum cofactor biosynthesis enzyme MoaA